MRGVVSILLVGLILASGCLGAARPAAPDPSEGVKVRPAESERDDAIASSPVRVVTVEHGWVGSFSYSARACQLGQPTSCASINLGSQENQFYRVPLTGQPLAAAATLTWDAATPVTEKLQVTMRVLRSCGDGCFDVAETWSARGASPITLDRVEFASRPGDVLRVDVEVPPQVDDPRVVVTAEQAFRVAGAFDVVTPA
jgi:hypothetical protein